MRTDFVLSHPNGAGRSVMEVKTVVDTDISALDAAQLRRRLDSSDTVSGGNERVGTCNACRNEGVAE